MFNLGPGEWIVILIIVLLLFGSTKIPQLARSLGKSVNEFKKGMKEGEEGADDKSKESDDEEKKDKKS